jgi:glycolate oxidase FAD binding subunit
LPSVSSLAEASAFLASASVSGRRVRIGEELTAGGLDRILEHEAGDLTCTVESGVRLSELQRALALHGQRLSLDPPGDPTVGALLAENASGPLRHRFGAPRDLLLGVTLVLADGTVANAGGKVVKNVAGYDLGRLVCGSQGRLAFVARASFRLHPLPATSATVVTAPDDVAAAVAALLRSHLQPSGLDVMHPGRIALLFEGAERAVAAQLAGALSLVGGAEANDGVWSESRRRQAEARGRLRFAPGDLRRVLAEVDEAIVRPAAGVAYITHPAPSDKLSQGDSAPVERLVERIQRQLDPRGVLSGGPPTEPRSAL